MKVCVVGTGYVGLVTGTCFAEMGNDVICVDVDEAKVEALQRGEVPIYEPGLEEMVRRNSVQGRLGFTTSLADGVEQGEIIFIAVGTPTSDDGSADLQYVLAVAKEIGEILTEPRIVVTKSTVPVGTTERVKETVQTALDQRGVDCAFSVASNPEFLKEGAAVQDFMRPDRIILGCEDGDTEETLRELYSSFLRTHDRVLAMDLRSSEMTKYASNAMLATKISFINEIANICDQVGADVGKVRLGMGADQRIGYKFLFPGTGYGGSCFPKDVKALAITALDHGYEPDLIQAVDALNDRQKTVLARKVLRHFEDTHRAPDQCRVAVWGLAFKPNTNDVREAPALTLIRLLLEAGIDVAAHDPVALETARAALGDPAGLTWCEDNYETLAGADALAICTEWGAYRRPDFARMKELLGTPVIFDGRNLYEPERMSARGFVYHGVGRSNVERGIGD